MSEETQQGGAVATQQQPAAPQTKSAEQAKKEKSCLMTALVCIAALVYLIFPIDVITDLLPGVGWVDDLIVCVWAVAFVFGKKYFWRAIRSLVVTLIALCYPLFPWQIIADDVPTWGHVDDWAICLWGVWRVIRFFAFCKGQVDTAKDMVRRL